MRDLTLDVGGPVHLVDHGGDGPPLLLVHGLAGSHVDWRDVVPGLGRHHHVYTVDLIGFGKTPAEGRTATIGDNVRLLTAVVEALAGSGKVALVGNSMGGLVSLVAAAKRPQHVDALVLVNPALPRGRGGRMSAMLFLTFLMLATPGVGSTVVTQRVGRASSERLVDDALRLCALDAGRITPATRAAQVELTEWRRHQDRPHQAFMEASRSLIRWLWNWKHVERFMAAVTVPTLLLVGDRDRVVPIGAAREAARLRPDWTFHVMDETGHIPQMERPEEFVVVVDGWLAATGRPGAPPAVPVRRDSPDETGGGPAIALVTTDHPAPPPTSRRYSPRRS